MKRVLFYTDSPGLGGAEKQMLLLAKNLRSFGYQPSLAYGKYAKIEKMRNEFEKHCEEVLVLPAIHKHDPRHYSALKRILDHQNFDLIHIHLWNPGSCRYAFFAADHSGVPIVTTEHDYFELRGLKKVIKKNCLKKVRQSVVINVDNMSSLVQHYEIAESRVNSIHNGIDPMPFLDSVSNRSWTTMDNMSSKNWADFGLKNIKNNDVVITCVAEMHSRKGQEYLIKAFQKLDLKSPRFQLVLVGVGPNEIALKRRYVDDPQIHFMGWQNDIPKILQNTDILVLPSLKEAFGLVLLEAMVSGVITISTDKGGNVDFVKHKQTGYLVPPKDPKAIMDAIVDIIRHPDQKAEIEARAREMALSKFTDKAMTKQYVEVYNDVII